MLQDLSCSTYQSFDLDGFERHIAGFPVSRSVSDGCMLVDIGAYRVSASVAMV